MTKTKIQIKSVFGVVLFEYKGESLKEAVVEAVKQKVNLSFADLSCADLSCANLRFSDLSCADLRSADLRFANLRFVNLLIYKHDFWAVLLAAPNEIGGLRDAIIAGKIDGSCYEDRKGCACLKGTIARVRGVKYRNLSGADCMKPDADSPAEVLFSWIRPGNTPKNHWASKFALDALDEFLKLRNEAHSKGKGEA